MGTPIRRRFPLAIVFVAWLGLALSLALGGVASEARAEIYRWTDEKGQLHFSQDLDRMPARYRAQAEAEARGGRGGREIQRYRAAPAAASPSRARTGSFGASKGLSSKVHRIRVARAGSTMRVDVRLNDRVVAPFYIDTGASDVVLPEWAARELGLELDEARTAYYATANGTVRQPVVVLDSVELGDARAEQVPASVSRSMSTGLLGLSFFNHFQYEIDPVAGVVTLRPNGLVEAGLLRGGRSEMQWRMQFRAIMAREDAIEQALREARSGGSRRRDQLREALEEAGREHRLLEYEADEARVPMQWRD